MSRAIMLEWWGQDMAFSWTHIQSVADLETSRAGRFRPEWRGMLLGYFGLEPGMRVLEVGCGPGTLAPYLAGGLQPGGTMVGVDLDATFIEHARLRAPDDGTVTYQVAAAYALPFVSGSFDAAVSYTATGVLADPERALREIIRVVRPGGSVGIAEAISGPFGFHFDGWDSLCGPPLYPEAPRYWSLRSRLMTSLGTGRIAGIGNPRWPARALPALLAAVGLTDLHLNAWGYVKASDGVEQGVEEGVEEMHGRAGGDVNDRALDAIVAAIREDSERASVLTTAEWGEWERLAAARRAWHASHHDFAYEAGLSLVVRARNRPLGGS
ncbi:MAG: class I SAM-dependent methyltransferase [Clostridia bacterium]